MTLIFLLRIFSRPLPLPVSPFRLFGFKVERTRNLDLWLVTRKSSWRIFLGGNISIKSDIVCPLVHHFWRMSMPEP